MEKLQVGDKVYNVSRDGFEDFARYSFSEVERLTKTLAVLKNGTRLFNEPRESFIMESVGYPVKGEWGTHWHKVSIQAIRQAQMEAEKIKIHDWFEKREFSLEEKKKVFELFRS
ncbi:pyruvate kinase [Sediminicola luteus]|uniref:Pyruvate kinase n=1 Tax=Sediminicola luteus TaxID=319238 RepID=A0A2A4G3T5_9FLAO|nr:pyruvate kinase [Sediminicola luteus]PCE62644.1 pyruvate kinase [Sediminicola luteus]